MFSNLFAYKWYAVAIAFLVYSVGVWNISERVAENDFNRERLRHAEEIIRIKQENDQLASQLSGQLQTALEQLDNSSKKHQKDLLDALAQDKRFSMCRVTDSVRELYKRKLQAQ